MVPYPYIWWPYDSQIKIMPKNLIVVLTFVDTNNKLGQDQYSAPLIICHVSDVITMY